MGNRRYAKSTRTLDWFNGSTNQLLTVVSDGAQQDLELITPITQGEHVTLTRIVGEVQLAIKTVDASFNVVGDTGHIINCGIQVVNRARGLGGTTREPNRADDREGREWMWMRHYFRVWQINDAVAGGPPSEWYIPVTDTGGEDQHVDIKVQRKIDLSQDAVIFSVNATSIWGGARTFEVLTNLRLLIRNS